MRSLEGAELDVLDPLCNGKHSIDLLSNLIHSLSVIASGESRIRVGEINQTHTANEVSTVASPAAEFGVSARWRMKDRVSPEILLLCLRIIFLSHALCTFVAEFGRIVPAVHPRRF